MSRLPIFSFLLLLVALLVPCTRGGAQELGTYEAEVVVSSQADGERNAALPRALEQVLVKLGGASAAGGDIGEDTAVSLLQQYRYRQEVVSVDGSPVSRLSLIARFDQAGVQRLLAGRGVAAWPAQRPEPILWLAIDDGSGARMVSQETAAAVAPLVARATQRGLRVRLPAYDAQDRVIVYPRDLAGEENYAVDTATQRYGGPALIGWLRRAEGGWVADWRLRDGENEIGRWRSTDPQAAAALAAGADGAADALAQRHAQVALSGTPGRYGIVIEGVANGADYARVLATLRRQPIVRGVSPVVLRDDRLEVEVDLGAGVESLTRLLAGGALESVSVGDGATPTILALRH